MVSVQLSLQSGLWGRDAALDLLDRKYDGWLSSVGFPALYCVAEGKEFFTSDDVWAYLVEHFNVSPSERRVLGVVFRRGFKKGIIVKTGLTEKSVMPECHARDKALWRSTIYKKVKNVVDQDGRWYMVDTSLMIPGSDDK